MDPILDTLSVDEEYKRMPLPERRLWATCLLDGIREAVRMRLERLGKNKLIGAPVEVLHCHERWLMDDAWDYVGSFRWICDQLGMDHLIVRSKALMNARELAR